MPAESKKTSYLAKSLLFLGLLAVVILTLPLLGVAAFALRVIGLIALPLAILGIILFPRVRAWLASETDSAPAGTYFGLRIPPNLLLHPAHSWAGIDATPHVTVGADDLAQKALGPVEEVIFPAVGQTVEQGAPLFRIRRGDRNIAVKAPVSGEVVGTNKRLVRHPELINSSPYETGWVVKLEPADLDRDREGLLRSNRAAAWFRAEVDRLMDLVTPRTLSSAVAQDGGTLVGDFHEHLDAPTWRRVNDSFFGGDA